MITSSISKKRAQKKFYRGDFQSLRQHINVESAYQDIRAYGELEVICRYYIRHKDKTVGITPIGIVLSDEPIEGETKLRSVDLEGAECLAVQDMDIEGNVIKTLGIQMSNEVMDGLMEHDKLDKQIMSKIR